MGCEPAPVEGFNEAEALKPRIPGVSAGVSDIRIKRFNEAEALKPRIRQAGSGSKGCPRQRFNEAEALKPRIPASAPALPPPKARLQ